ncbi:MAG: LPS export ABC transporter periplasmic protein LptC [Sphingobacteriales bacterium 50-39]|nr:LPS export ABC transporter periplasmic protein LptC [Sphingobacteriales bacterium]OJW57150.1 MAG: LPS export ABC transporter periplasmic protein LptC [Sphingobacteriales bacterium 50-39]
MSSANTILNKLCTIAAALTLLYSCENKIKDLPSSARSSRAQVPEEGRQIESYLSEAGKVKGKLTSPYMLRYQKADTPYSEFPRTLHVDFYNDSTNIESQMDAKYGKYLQNQNKVFLRDSVVVKNILKGDTLHCKYLWWDQNTQKFTTDDSVQIYTKDKILFGTGMEADQNFRWYTIKHLTGSVLTSENAMPMAPSK